MLTYTPDNTLFFAVDFDRFDCENVRTGHGHWAFTCTITADGKTIDAGPLRSGTTTQDQPPGLGEMLATFLTFFSAYVEAVHRQSMGHHVENADLFSHACRPIAKALDADQVALWAEDIRPSR